MEQIKNNFTQIPNNLIDILMSKALNETEIKILLFIARKTYGFQKSSDQISYSQFQNKLGLSRPTITVTLKRLQLVKFVLLVKKGNSKRACNEWLIDYSNYPDKLVKLTKLVKYDKEKLVKYTLHTKESITKEKGTVENFTKPHAENVATQQNINKDFASLLQKDNFELKTYMQNGKWHIPHTENGIKTEEILTDEEYFRRNDL